jgi:DHA1 family bicyclomycin/chloramphenicol resistance-like MFS transporter
MAALSLVFVAKFLPESTKPDYSALKLSVVGARYKVLLKNSDFLIHSAILGLALGMIFVFITAAPFVVIDLLGVSVDGFGYFQATIVLAFFFGSVLASRLADHWDGFRLMSLGVVIVIVGALVLALVILGNLMTLYTLTASIMIVMFGMGPLFAVAPSRALRSIEGNAGSSSALLNGIEQTTAGVAAVMISVFHDGSARPMALVIVLLVVLLLCLLYRSKLEDQLKLAE